MEAESHGIVSAVAALAVACLVGHRILLEILAAEVHPEHALVVDELEDVVVDRFAHLRHFGRLEVLAIEAVGENRHQEDLRVRMFRRHLTQHETDRLGDILCAIGMLVVVDALLVAVVDADHQREVLRGIAVKRTVPKTPQEVLDAVAADAHVERRGIVDGIPVEGQTRVVPEIGDGVAEQDHVEVLALAAADVSAEVVPVVVVRALLRRTRLRTVIRSRHLGADHDRIAERNERSGGED